MVIRLVATGRTNRQIADTLVISEKTVARHLSNVFTKLGLATGPQPPPTPTSTSWCRRVYTGLPIPQRTTIWVVRRTRSLLLLRSVIPDAS